MTIDDKEKTVVLTEKQFKEISFKAVDELTDEVAKDAPQKGLMVLMMGALISSKICKVLFDAEEQPESEEAMGKLKFGDE